MVRLFVMGLITGKELERMTWDVTGGVSGGGGGEDKVFPVLGQSAGRS